LLLGILAVAATTLGADSRLMPRERVTIETEPFVVTARLIEGWSVDRGQLVPREALRSACRVHQEVVRGGDWNTAVAGAMRDAIIDKRELLKSGEHVAVKYETKDTESVYIDLGDIEPGSFAVWNVENDDNAAGRQCRSEFGAVAYTVGITAAAQPR